MRMIHYFGGLAVLASALLIATAWSGLGVAPSHLALGLAGAVTAVAAHSLLILFMIITGRILREAMRARSLPADFLVELNGFFARKAAYPAALFSVLVTATAAVLGYGQRAFDLPTWIHPLAGVTALGMNLITFVVEHRTLRENQRLMDRAEETLDAIDRQLESRRVAPDAEEEGDPLARVVRLGWTIALGAWLPYLYQLVIVWKGRASRVSLHPWVEVSALGVAVLLLALRERARPDEA